MPPDDTLEGTSVLLTGATGLIGGEILHRLLELEDRGPRRIYCLVRDRPHQTGRDRLLERLSRSRYCEGLGDRVVAVVGDLTDPAVTASLEVRDQMRSSVDLVIHCAAVTFFLRPRECEEVNIQGLRHLLSFIAECERPVRFVFLGSAAACGDRKETRLLETDYPEASDSHAVYYTKTKAIAEGILRQQTSLAQLLILRPSIVLPDNVVSGPMRSDVLWALVLMREIRALPIPSETRIDAISLTYLGQCAVRLISRRRPEQDCYHISAGEAGSAIWSDVVALLQDQFGTDIQACDDEAWELVKPSLTPHERRLVRVLGTYLPFLQRNVVFDDARLRRELGDGIPLLEHYRTYLPRLLESITHEEAMLRSVDP